jgi:hypothetical protein
MTERNPKSRETVTVIGLAGTLAIVLTVVAMWDSSPGSLTDIMARAVASIDPALDSAAPHENGLPQTVPGKVVVAGLPEGFFVRLDGMAYPRGNTADLEIPARPGAHRLEIVNRDGEAWVTRVTVPGSGAVTARPELSGEIVVETGTGHAIDGLLYVDGHPVAALPATIDSASIGSHLVEIRADTGVVWRSEIVVRNASVTRVEIPEAPSPR